jgi:5-formyltetrahydrofolate cyclo-ligase
MEMLQPGLLPQYMSERTKVLKQELRMEFQKKRLNLDPDLAMSWSEEAQAHLTGSDSFARAGVLALYAAFNKEVSLDRVFEEARRRDKETLFPRMGAESGEMSFYPVKDFSEMRKNSFGILEPSEKAGEAALTDIDLILVPGVAYDRAGWRLGMGGGYYDRALGKMRKDTESIGVAYSIQLAESLPHDDYDRRVSLIVTEKGFIAPSVSGPA